jgi:hypothetical protein
MERNLVHIVSTLILLYDTHTFYQAFALKIVFETFNETDRYRLKLLMQPSQSCRRLDLTLP